MAPHLPTDFLKKLFVPAGSAFVVFLFLIIFQYVFKLDFACPCDPKENISFCTIYMVLPAVSLFIVVIITDKRTMTICCNCTCSKLCCISGPVCIILMSAIKGVSVASLWIITLLIDGDWYVCLKTTNYTIAPYEQTFCKKNKTPAEDAEIRVKESCSRTIALWILFGLSLLWILASMSSSLCMCSLAYQYEKLQLEETHRYISNQLKNQAEDTAQKNGQKKITEFRKYLGLSPPPPECVVLETFQLVAQASEPQQPATVQHDVSETQQSEGTALRTQPQQLNVLLKKFQIIAKQTQLEQPEEVLLANIDIKAKRLNVLSPVSQTASHHTNLEPSDQFSSTFTVSEDAGLISTNL